MLWIMRRLIRLPKGASRTNGATCGRARLYSHRWLCVRNGKPVGERFGRLDRYRVELCLWNPGGSLPERAIPLNDECARAAAVPKGFFGPEGRNDPCFPCRECAAA